MEHFLKIICLFQLLYPSIKAAECIEKLAQLSGQSDEREILIKAQVQGLLNSQSVLDSQEFKNGIAQGFLSNIADDKLLTFAIQQAQSYLNSSNSPLKEDYLQQIAFLQDSPIITDLLFLHLSEKFKKYKTHFNQNFIEGHKGEFYREKLGIKLGALAAALSVPIGYAVSLYRPECPGYFNAWIITMPIFTSILPLPVVEFLPRKFTTPYRVTSFGNFKFDISPLKDLEIDSVLIEGFTLAALGADKSKLAISEMENMELEQVKKQASFKIPALMGHTKGAVIPLVLIARGEKSNTWLAVDAKEYEEALRFRNRISLFQISQNDLEAPADDSAGRTQVSYDSSDLLKKHAHIFASILIPQTLKISMRDQSLTTKKQMLRQYILDNR